MAITLRAVGIVLLIGGTIAMLVYFDAAAPNVGALVMGMASISAGLLVPGLVLLALASILDALVELRPVPKQYAFPTAPTARHQHEQPAKPSEETVAEHTVGQSVESTSAGLKPETRALFAPPPEPEPEFLREVRERRALNRTMGGRSNRDSENP